jgi:TrmH family RNA methyltransferase
LSSPVVVVLVGTRAPGNLGAVCRIAKAFGFPEVRLVAPEAGPGDEDAGRLARGAEDVLAAAREYPSLRAALGGCRRSGATTARARHWSRPVLHPADCAEAADADASAPYAVVFGPEDHGLTNEDLAECDEILSVPLPPGTGATLSLPASASIVLYELARARGAVRPAARGPRSEWSGRGVDAAEIEAMVDEMGAVFDEIGLRPVPDAVRFRGTLRDFLGRARPTVGDRRILRYVFAQVGKWKRRVLGELRRGELVADADADAVEREAGLGG